MQFSSKMTTWSFSSANPFLERQKLCPHPHCTSDPVSLSAEDVRGEPEIAPQRLLSLLLTAPAYTSAALSVLLTFENKSLITQNVLYEVGARRCWPYIQAWNSAALNSATFPTLLLQPCRPCLRTLSLCNFDLCDSFYIPAPSLESFGKEQMKLRHIRNYFILQVCTVFLWNVLNQHKLHLGKAAKQTAEKAGTWSKFLWPLSSTI